MKKEKITSLYREYMKPVYLFLRSKGCSHQDAEDVVQETFYQAMLHLDSINPASLSGWVFRVALNRYYDLCRRQRKEPQLMLDQEIFHALLSVTGDGEEVIQRRELQHTVIAALNELTPVFRDLLFLKYGMEFSYREIAALTDSSEASVKTSLYRARQEFRRKWEGLVYEG